MTGPVIWEPYTLDVDARMNLETPNSRHSSNRVRVPSTLVS